MRPPLYDEVHQLSLDIVNASAIEDTRAEWNAYTKLRELCEANEESAQNHPFQWEALGGFTHSQEGEAIRIYQKALQYSESLGLQEYSASINLALAERYQDIEENELALELAYRAYELAETTNNLELRKEISEFLLSANTRT